MNNDDLYYLKKENEALKEALTKVVAYMHIFMPEHFDSKNPKHIAMYEAYHVANHAIRN